MTRKEILADLRQIFPQKTHLTPADLAIILGTSTKQQHNLRKEGKLNIPMTQIGKRLYVTIYNLAAWLAGETFVKDDIPSPKNLQPKKN
jgi:hypothetical protein